MTAAPLTRAIPDLRQYHRDAPERRLTFRECLSHQTHLPAVEPLYTYGLDPNTARAFILQRDWQAGPPVYSDINFMLLGIAIERLKACKLTDLELPPGLTLASGAIGDRGDRALHLAWPRDTRRSARRECLRARWRCWPRRPFRDDRRGPRCAQRLLGGVDPWLSETPYERQTATRCLGWEARHEGWSGGNACSETTIGHTGFTGTGVWIDFARGLAWTLLTNRVHPTRHRDTGIDTLRRKVGDLIVGQVS